MPMGTASRIFSTSSAMSGSASGPCPRRPGTLADLVTEPAPRTVLAREAARRGLLQYAYLLAKPAAADSRDVTAAGIVAEQYWRWGNTDAAVDLWTQAASRHH